MAAGCTVAEDDLATFGTALGEVAAEWLQPAALARRVVTDGPLAIEYFNAETLAAIDGQVWGQGFEAPMFCDEVQVIQQRLVGEKHLKMKLKHSGQVRDAIWFSHAEPVHEKLRVAYRLSLNEFQGRSTVEMVIEAAVAME